MGRASSRKRSARAARLILHPRTAEHVASCGECWMYAEEVGIPTLNVSAGLASGESQVSAELPGQLSFDEAEGES
jgi:hypothetical protein